MITARTMSENQGMLKDIEKCIKDMCETNDNIQAKILYDRAVYKTNVLYEAKMKEFEKADMPVRKRKVLF